MQIIKTIAEMKETIQNKLPSTIGFVPTMGFLHEGHLSLAKEAKKENDLLVMSIFVNPLQFGPNEDFDQYPRDEKRDIQLAKEIGTDILFIPSVEEMYPTKSAIQMTILDRTNVLCGESRPGHFDGVITVLTKLFHIIQPTKAYFGLKDAQQIAVIDALIIDLNFPINLVGLPTKRERNGLAMSSRNVYLSNKEREEAVILYESLQKAKELIKIGTTFEKVKKVVENSIKEKITSAKIDYISIFSYPYLKKVNKTDNIIIAVAVYFEKARLIDNIILNQNGTQLKRFTRGEA